MTHTHVASDSTQSDSSQHLLPGTPQRVPRNTSRDLNERIRRRTEASIRRHGAAGPEAIRRRLEELDREWDIERTIEANAATLGLVGVGLGAFVNRWFLLLPGAVTAFLLQHALQGWCPPVPILRRLGKRTQTEIDEERYALKALRGDFAPVSRAPGDHDFEDHAFEDHAQKAIEAVRSRA